MLCLQPLNAAGVCTTQHMHGTTTSQSISLANCYKQVPAHSCVYRNQPSASYHSLAHQNPADHNAVITAKRLQQSTLLHAPAVGNGRLCSVHALAANNTTTNSTITNICAAADSDQSQLSTLT
jgi:hypothetical protein